MSTADEHPGVLVTTLLQPLDGLAINRSYASGMRFVAARAPTAPVSVRGVRLSNVKGSGISLASRVCERGCLFDDVVLRRVGRVAFAAERGSQADLPPNVSLALTNAHVSFAGMSYGDGIAIDYPGLIVLTNVTVNQTTGSGASLVTGPAHVNNCSFSYTGQKGLYVQVSQEATHLTWSSLVRNTTFSGNSNHQLDIYSPYYLPGSILVQGNRFVDFHPRSYYASCLRVVAYVQVNSAINNKTLSVVDNLVSNADLTDIFADAFSLVLYHVGTDRDGVDEAVGNTFRNCQLNPDKSVLAFEVQDSRFHKQFVTNNTFVNNTGLVRELFPRPAHTNRR